MSPLVAVSVVIGALVVAGAAYQVIGLKMDARRYPPPGEQLDIGGRRLHVVCRGTGSPAVVFESALAASSTSWARVLPDVARFTTACAYDRAGLGWSDEPTTPRTLARIVDDLHRMVTARGVPHKMVLTGHSFGAFVCLAYAAEHPHEIAGLVLVDPPVEWVNMDARQTYLLRGGAQLSRLGGVLARLGVVRLSLALLTGGAPAVPRHFVKVFGATAARTLERLVGEVRKLPRELYPVVQATWCQPKCFRAMAENLRVFPEAAAAVPRFQPSPDLPLIVISGGDQPATVLTAHQALAAASRRGQHVMAAGSGHWVPFDQPDLVIDAVRHVVDAARGPVVSMTRSRKV